MLMLRGVGARAARSLSQRGQRSQKGEGEHQAAVPDVPTRDPLRITHTANIHERRSGPIRAASPRAAWTMRRRRCDAVVAHMKKRPWVGLPVSVAAAALGAIGLAACGDSDTSDTASPIKHVIIIVGENRSFDHLFATYVPRHPEEGIHNLLSEQIVTASGAPGASFSKAYQYQITSAPNGGKFFISADRRDKTLYTTLPPPDVYTAPTVSPNIPVLNLPGGDPELLPQDQFLLGTGGTGLSYTLGPDTRIANVLSLPPGPFQLTGPTMPFDAFTGDLSHLYFTMVQQADCAIDAEHVSSDNPTGCLHDLQSAVNTTYATSPGTVPHDTGQTMAFFNMQQGDAPVFKHLADL